MELLRLRLGVCSLGLVLLSDRSLADDLIGSDQMLEVQLQVCLAHRHQRVLRGGGCAWCGDGRISK